MLAARRFLGTSTAAAPTFKAATTAATSGITSSSLSISSPACSTGDMLILAVHTRTRNVASNPTGWGTPFAGGMGTDSGGRDIYFNVYVKTATSTDAAGTTYAITCGTNDNIVLACLCYSPSSVETSSTHASTITDSGPTSWSPTTVTTSGANRVIVSLWGESSGSSFTSGLGAPSVGTTTRATAWDSSSTRAFARVLAVDETLAAAGTTPTRTATASVGGGWVAVALALKS